jgi:hypothetical protein
MYFPLGALGVAERIWLVLDKVSPTRKLHAKKALVLNKSAGPYRPGLTFNASYENALATRVAASGDEEVRKLEEKKTTEQEWEMRQSGLANGGMAKARVALAPGSGRW